jgi:hypothetical protein
VDANDREGALMNRREVLKSLASAAAVGTFSAMAPTAIAATATTAPAPASAPARPLEKNDLQFWLETSLKRVYPNSPPGSAAPLRLLAARNQKLSFQACFGNRKINSVRVRCEVVGAPQGWDVRVRRVGFVPLRNFNTHTPADELEGIGQLPGMCPDPLYPEPTAHVGPKSNGAFWISVTVPEGAAVGTQRLTVRLTHEDEFSYTDWVRGEPWSIELHADVEVASLVVKPRKDFPVTQWISADSIWEYYRIEPCGDRFWQLARAYIADVVSHNVDVVYTPLINNRHEILKRPAQLLRVTRVGQDRYAFDFTDVRKWVRIAMESGANYVEWPHFFTPAPTSGKYPQRIYARDEQGIGALLWPPETSATGETYRKFLEQFIPQFKRFLEAEGVLEKSLFHCADEPDGDVQMADYRKARALLKELAPWMKVMDAMSDPRFATEKLSDMPVPSIATAPAFTAANCPAWVYFCCGPREKYLQRLLDTPLAKIRMSGWLFYRLGAKGFLHWGHNYWFVFCTDQIGDPFADAAVGAWPGLPAGDPFVVYPGADGPLDSIRWEVFSESLQDYAILQSAGVQPDDPMLAEIKDYREFPKSEAWLRSAIAKVMKSQQGAS